METFAYVMAGIMALTAGLMITFLRLRDKWANIVRYDALNKNVQYQLLASICAAAIIIEILVLFGAAIANIIHKLIFA